MTKPKGFDYSYHMSSGGWYITRFRKGGYSSPFSDKVMYSYSGPEDEGGYFERPPKAIREKYEELLGRPEFVSFDEDVACETTGQIVEMMAADEARFDQPCKFGCLVPGHSVYCHNDGWLYSPRKCHRTWYTGGKTRDEDCLGFKPNPNGSAHE